jgi:hypothetical protein
MSLEMRDRRGRCGRDLGWEDPASIRSHESTFCGGCAAEMGRICPNCGGELVRRTRRETA